MTRLDTIRLRIFRHPNLSEKSWQVFSIAGPEYAKAVAWEGSFDSWEMARDWAFVLASTLPGRAS